MGTITNRTKSGRPKPYLVQIKHSGKTYSKSFSDEAEAKLWMAEQDYAYERGNIVDPKRYSNTKVGDLARRYLEEESTQKPTYITEKYVIGKFLQRPIAKKSLNQLQSGDGAAYRKERLNDTYGEKVLKDGTKVVKKIKPSTVRRELNILQHIFEIARTEWNYDELKNPFRAVKVKGSFIKRKRRLNDGELYALLKTAMKECRGTNKMYASLAILLAVHTGMRLQEIFNLTWEDVDLERWRIRILKSKTGKPRTITMNPLIWAYLTEGRGHGWSGNKSDKVFPMMKSAFKQMWEKTIKKKAGIDDLTFHDLRHEAGSRFDELGLTKHEHDLMMGHEDRSMAALYTHTEEKHLKAIQQKFADGTYDYADEFNEQIKLVFGGGYSIPQRPSSTPQAKKEGGELR